MPGQDEQVQAIPADGVQTKLARKKLPLELETLRFSLVSLLDIIMTYLVIRYSEEGRTSAVIGEGNPLPAFFIDQFGMPGMVGFKIFLVAFVVGISQIVYRTSKMKARFMLNVGTVLVAVVVLYSLSLLLGNWTW